jgi:chromosome partitioning protein
MIAVVAVVMNKGGSSKTTTVTELGTQIAQKGFRTVIIDLDFQANATKAFGIIPAKLNRYVGELFEAPKTNPKELLLETIIPNLYIIPSSIKLSPIASAPPTGSEIAIKRAVAKIWDDFDYVFIDTPPGLGVMPTAALAAATHYLIPVQCEPFALDGIEDLMNAIINAQDALNEDLQSLGVYMAMVDERNNLTKTIISEVKEYFGEKVFNTIVRKSVKLPEAQGARVPIQIHLPSNNVAEDYRNLAEEVLSRL